MKSKNPNSDPRQRRRSATPKQHSSFPHDRPRAIGDLVCKAGRDTMHMDGSDCAHPPALLRPHHPIIEVGIGMPHLKSLYPPIPDIDIPNYYDFVTGLEHFKSLPDYTLFIDGLTGEKRRLRAFFERVDACATALASEEAVGGLNVLANPNEIVGIFSENSMEWPTLVYSCLKLGVPFALLPAYSTAAEFRHLLKTSESTRLFVSPSVFETALTVAREVGLPEDRIGTSGLPKAVMISHKNLCYSLMQTVTIGREFAKVATPPPPNTPEGVPCAVAFMPFYHVTAFHLCMMRIFTPPCTIVILPRWKLDTVLDALQKYDVTNFGLVPSMAHEFINSPRFQTTDFSKVASFMSGAAQLPLEHRKAILERMPHVHIRDDRMYISIPRNSPPRPLPRPHQMLTMTGILLPGCEARIVREDGSEAGYDEPGELLVRGGHVALGYWKNEAATRGSFLLDRWLRTGDQFTVDRQGAF
ncbi:hypothetical protein EWM64_g5883 [Hericium alpestre]|uniref:AMP-dependent synthetase/ligase domain-containing protein n=1 Tax=Hericium alpestre TaxID=135208 RepID=A0A4Y9ZV71_9AGAM|nr:hypothetical protein EWM64_g5883 [Hericium alpestre]